MADLLIRDLDPVVVDNIKVAARQRGVSVTRLLADKLTADFAGDAERLYRDLDALAGTWSARDAAEFEQATAPFSEVDPELWKPARRRR
jgi:hypothetical protein